MQFLSGLADFSFCHSKFKLECIDDAGILARAAEWGAQVVQVDCCLKMAEGAGASRQQLAAQAQKCGVQLSGAMFDLDITSAGLEAGVRACAELGAPTLRCAVSMNRAWHQAKPVDELAAIFRTVVPLCEELGVTIGLENHQDYSSADLVDWCQQVGSERVGICLDTGNSLAVFEDPMDTARLLAPYTKLVHLKEYVLEEMPGGYALLGVRLGTGVIDNPAILALLRDAAPVERLPILVENPLEWCPVFLLNPQFVATAAAQPYGQLAAIPPLIARSKELFPGGVQPLNKLGLDAEAQFALETWHNQQAFAYCQQQIAAL